MPTRSDHTYLFDNGWEQAQRRLRSLERTYDPGSTRRLDALGVGPGWRCLEVGAGGGSITRWLCSKVSPAGRVLAIDLDTRFVADIRAGNLDVACLDVTIEALPHDAYDLVHARAVLCHLPTRDQVLAKLVAALVPGGWLLLEEPDVCATRALASGLHATMVAELSAALAQAGFAPTWARDLPSRLQSAGLIEVGAESELPLVQGGSVEAELFPLTGLQIREQLLAAGIAPEQLEVWEAALGRPGDWFPGCAFVAAWGRRR